MAAVRSAEVTLTPAGRPAIAPKEARNTSSRVKAKSPARSGRDERSRSQKCRKAVNSVRPGSRKYNSRRWRNDRSLPACVGRPRTLPSTTASRYRSAGAPNGTSCRSSTRWETPIVWLAVVRSVPRAKLFPAVSELVISWHSPPRTQIVDHSSTDLGLHLAMWHPASQSPLHQEPPTIAQSRVALSSRCAAASNPVVNLAGLELPQATDLVGGHALLSDPGVDGVLGDAKMNSDVVS
jgi:hypothetical protein